MCTLRDQIINIVQCHYNMERYILETGIDASSSLVILAFKVLQVH